MLSIAVTNLLDKEIMTTGAGRVLLLSQVAESQRAQVCSVVVAPAMLLFLCLSELAVEVKEQDHVWSDTSSVLSMFLGTARRIKSLAGFVICYFFPVIC